MGHTKRNKWGGKAKLRTEEGPSRQEVSTLVTLFNQRRYPEAATLAQAMTERFPLHWVGWTMLGAAFQQMGRGADALAPLQKVAALSPHDVKAHYNLANILRHLGRLEEAAASYRRALQIEPNHAEAHFNLGNTLRDLGRLDEAEASYRRALQVKPDYAEAHINLGNTLRKLGRLEEATASYRHALEIKPGYADAHYNLGSVLRDLGRLDEAEASFRQVLEIEPASAETHYNLGNTLRDLGRFDEAAASYRRALEIKPDYAEAHNNLGNTLCDLGRFDEAAVSYRQAVQLMPDYADAHNNLGNALNDLGRLDEAEASYRRALEIKPDYADAHNNLGDALQDLGRLEEAEASYRRALEIDPNSAEALVALSEHAAGAGRFAEAEALVKRALAIVPEMPQALAAMAYLRKMTAEDTAWLAAAERVAARGGMRPRQELALRYALGKYFDDIKDFDRAFPNYRRAHELKKSLLKPYQRREHTLAIDALIRTCDRARMQKAQPGAPASALPLFIVGMPRSGTSLIEQIIASHPAAVGAGELPFWQDAVNRLGRAALEKELDEPVLGNLADECLRNLARFSLDAARVVDKMPGNFAYLGLIHTVFPNARILHTQRNPIDTCLSIYFHNFNVAHTYANDLEDLAHYYREYHRLMAHWRAVLPPAVFLDVPYEALVDDQEGWSRRIIEFIGLGWDDRCLQFEKTERKVHTASNWQVRQKIYKTSKERWRNYEKYVGPLLPLLELRP